METCFPCDNRHATGNVQCFLSHSRTLHVFIVLVCTKRHDSRILVDSKTRSWRLCSSCWTGYPRKHLIIFRAMSDDDMRTIVRDQTKQKHELKRKRRTSLYAIVVSRCHSLASGKWRIRKYAQGTTRIDTMLAKRHTLSKRPLSHPVVPQNRGRDELYSGWLSCIIKQYDWSVLNWHRFQLSKGIYRNKHANGQTIRKMRRIK